MTEESKPVFSLNRIFIFWVPMAATWLMMSVEGPFLAAVIARLAEPKFNLAAYGVAFAFAVLLEAPVVMIMSASTALVQDKESFLRLKRFTYTLNLLVTAVMIIFLLPSVFNLITTKIMGLPVEVVSLTHWACIALLPWPAAIGYRRFYQGILIRSGLTRLVAYGTVTRIFFMSMTAVILAVFFQVNGALVGAAALSAGVTAEAAASRLMAIGSVRKLLQFANNDPPGKELNYRYIFQFYYPLALTSILALGVYPLVTFFMGHSRMALESLAVLPVVNSLVFIFRSMGLSFQEVSIAVLSFDRRNLAVLKKFALRLAFFASAALFLVAFSPVSHLWFRGISGLSPALSEFALPPTRILVVIPALTVLLAFIRAFLVTHRRTKPITLATGIEVGTIAGFLILNLEVFNLVGAVAAALAMVSGRFLADLYLLFIKGERPPLLEIKVML